MSGSDTGPASSIRRPRPFVTTRWSVVLAAGCGDTTASRAALETLCQTYWYPLYAYLRRTGHGPHDAEDLLQSFLARCLEKEDLADADRSKGRFRSFLLLLLKRFLANERDKANAQKRGGGIPVVSLDGLTAEERYASEPADLLSADKHFDRRWALTLLDRVLMRIRDEQAAAGRADVFEQLKDSLMGSGAGSSNAELGERCGLSEGAVKVAVHRLRRRYRELLEEEIARTVTGPEDIDEERRQLRAALGG